jgi:monovalent cation:H+ antiporter, CPA1 family
LLLSLALIAVGDLGFGVKPAVDRFLAQVPFGTALLQWMLGFLLFAGALTVDVNKFTNYRWLTAALATIGTALSTLILGCLAWMLFQLLGLDFSFRNSLVLGAVLSPTDPVAILGVMRRAGASRDIENVVAAESLFNDGVGVVLFLALVGFARDDGSASLASATAVFMRQAFGGAVLGFVTGTCVFQLLKRVFRYQLAVLLTLALVMGTYSLADVLHVSGPIAVVVAGLLLCNQGRIFHLATEVGDDLQRFWDLIDEILNAGLFLLIGMQVMVITGSWRALVVAVLTIPVVLLARWLSVSAIVTCFTIGRRSFGRAMSQMLTWGGLRGGLTIAMALSLPSGIVRDRIVLITYVVVIFSIVVQGTTAGAFFRRVTRRGNLNAAERSDPVPFASAPQSGNVDAQS